MSGITFFAAIVAAASLLQTEAPNYYDATKALIKDVKQTTTYSRVDVESGVVYLTSDHWRASTEWLASVFVHEACHVWLWQNGQQATGPSAEFTCNAIQRDALELVGGSPYEIQYLLNLNNGI